jgi:hypothetical protein
VSRRQLQTLLELCKFILCLKLSKIGAFQKLTDQSCGSTLFVDLSSGAAERFLVFTAPTTRPNPDNSILPSYNSQTAASSRNRTTRQISQSPAPTHQPPQSSNSPPSTTQSQRHGSQVRQHSQSNQSRYIHWCVDSNKWETQLHHIEVSSRTDQKFIDKLKENYEKTFGLWRWFSLTTCHSVKFVEVRLIVFNLYILS